jgi:hypothetical protein
VRGKFDLFGALVLDLCFVREGGGRRKTIGGVEKRSADVGKFGGGKSGGGLGLGEERKPELLALKSQKLQPRCRSFGALVFVSMKFSSFLSARIPNLV